MPPFKHIFGGCPPAGQAARRPRTVARAEAMENVVEATSGGPKAVPTSTEWEMDFCSRPIVDERGKKVWELLICDPTRSFEYAQYFPNNKINSAEVRHF
jgi:hypothetical protein